MQSLPSEIRALAGKRVLICEDEGITIMQLSRAATLSGLVVAGIASDVPTALNVALRERPDIVLLDISLPGGDGFQLIRDVVNAFSPCVITLVAQSDEVALAAAAGACASLVKPADTADFHRVLPACVERFTHAVVRQPKPEITESGVETPHTARA